MSDMTTTSPRGDALVATVWMALVTGLVEGAGSVLLMKFGQLTGVWWDLLWISPLFDLLMFGGVGVVLIAIAGVLGRPWLDLLIPAYGFLMASIWLGLALPYQVHMVALLILSAGCAVRLATWARRHREALVHFWRRSLPWVLMASGVAFAVLAIGRPVRERWATARLPNSAVDEPDIVLIVVDALGADHLSTYGYGRETSPTIDRLAQQGSLFESAFSTSPYTGPSHASLLTGMYPSEHRLQWIERRPVLREDVPSIAEVLRERGYRTAAFSANRFWFTREQGFGRGFLRFEDNFYSLGDAFMRTAYGRKLDDWVLRKLFEDYPWRRKGEAITDAATVWANLDDDRPYFMFLNYFDVHDPYFPPEPYRALFSDISEPGGVLNSHQNRYHPSLTPELLAQEIEAYDGAIRYVDTEIQRLLDGLGASGADEDLIVVITSDHGEAFGEHGAYIHANALYREEIHVPLVIWAPGRAPAGFRSDAAVSNAAVPGTLLDLIGASTASFELASLAELWREGGTNPGYPLPISEMEHWPWNLETSPSHYGAARAVMTSDYHLIEHDSLGTELYRWRDDPTESRNLIAVDSLSTLVEGLRRALGVIGR